ncbi:MAG: DUF2809 domain-containing protein [Eubacteriaceae bacterium]|nr:DUF2809 domain-containing protein [Eubacteriaceae bacterium]
MQGKQEKRPNTAKLRIHKGYLLTFAALFAIEGAIALFVHDRFIRPYVGDMLVVAVVYFFVRGIAETPTRFLPVYVFLFAAAVEISQYFHLADALGLSANNPVRIMIGSTFDVSDIGCYFIGCLALFAYERLSKHV